MQYADFAVWQRERLRGEELGRLLAAARLRLAAPPNLELPADHRRPAAQSLRGRRLPWTFAAPWMAELRRFCEREGATPFAVLAAAFGALLARWSGQTDVVFGFPSANRDRIEIEPLVGCFVNTLVLRLGATGEPGFRELVRRARADALDAIALRDLPFEKLVEELAVGRSLSHAPLVQGMLALQNVELSLSLPGLDLRLVGIDNGTSKLDLTLALFEEGGGLRGWLEYSTDLFEAATVAADGGTFRASAGGAVGGAGAAVCGAAAAVGGRRRSRRCAEWNATRGRSLGRGCLHELFAAQVSRTPEALALVVGEERLSYGELAARARTAGGAAAGAGGGAGVRGGGVSGALVGAGGGRCWAILKAGGAYVPLDPAYPRERLA